MGSPNALALAFRSNRVCACAETKSRAFPTAQFLAAVGATRSQLKGPAPFTTLPSGLLRRGVASSLDRPPRIARRGGTGMKLPRRRFLHLVAGTAALPVMSRIARAQAYPTRPVRWVVGFPPGGGADTVARI